MYNVRIYDFHNVEYTERLTSYLKTEIFELVSIRGRLLLHRVRSCFEQFAFKSSVGLSLFVAEMRNEIYLDIRYKTKGNDIEKRRTRNHSSVQIKCRQCNLQAIVTTIYPSLT